MRKRRIILKKNEQVTYIDTAQKIQGAKKVNGKFSATLLKRVLPVKTSL